MPTARRATHMPGAGAAAVRYQSKHLFDEGAIIPSMLVQNICAKCGKHFSAPPYPSDPNRSRAFCSFDCGYVTHGHARRGKTSRTYNTWATMVSRCTAPTSSGFHKYGARGIDVCERWLTFENFLADMGERPPATTIDRIDGTKGYYPGNCRWATVVEQQANLSTNLNITYAGRTQTVAAWQRELGISTIGWRLRQGWSIEDAMTVRPHTGNRVRKTGQRMLELNGECHCLAEWARRASMSVALLRLRLSRGMSLAEAIAMPKGVFVTKTVAR